MKTRYFRLRDRDHRNWIVKAVGEHEYRYSVEKGWVPSDVLFEYFMPRSDVHDQYEAVAEQKAQEIIKEECQKWEDMVRKDSDYSASIEKAEKTFREKLSIGKTVTFEYLSRRYRIDVLSDTHFQLKVDSSDELIEDYASIEEILNDPVFDSVSIQEAIRMLKITKYEPFSK